MEKSELTGSKYNRIKVHNLKLAFDTQSMNLSYLARASQDISTFSFIIILQLCRELTNVLSRRIFSRTTLVETEHATMVDIVVNLYGIVLVQLNQALISCIFWDIFLKFFFIRDLS